MKCCNKECSYIDRWDDAQQTDHCFNIYLCETCGNIFKEDVWEDAGIIKINTKNYVERIKKSNSQKIDTEQIKV